MKDIYKKIFEAFSDEDIEEKYNTRPLYKRVIDQLATDEKRIGFKLLRQLLELIESYEKQITQLGKQVEELENKYSNSVPNWISNIKK